MPSDACAGGSALAGRISWRDHAGIRHHRSPAGDRRRHRRRRRCSTTSEPAAETLPAEVAELLASGEAQALVQGARAGPCRRQALADGRARQRAGLHPRARARRGRASRASAPVSCRRSALCWEPRRRRRDRRRDRRGARRGHDPRRLPLRSAQVEATGGQGRAPKQPRAPDRRRPRGGRERRRRAATARARPSPRRSTRARDLQNRPGNDLTPTALGRVRAGARRGDRGPAGRGRGPRGHRGARHGRLRRRRPGLRAGARADRRSDMRRPDARRAPTLGFVGKAVTFDSGGISLKPGRKWRR